MYDIVSAVNYLHSKKIVHRDIKPENFLIFPTNEGGKKIVKLCDFGLAVDARQILTEVCGSPSYVAPEVLRMQNYGLPVDIWSCGIVLYILLCHFPPFYGESTKKLFSKIMRGNYDFPSPYWDDISDNAKDLITRMLVVKDDRRIKSEEVVRHPWFNEVCMFSAFNRLLRLIILPLMNKENTWSVSKHASLSLLPSNCKALLLTNNL